MGIEIVDFPFKKVIFHSYVNVYQRGNPGYFWVHWLIPDIVGQFMLIHVRFGIWILTHDSMMIFRDNWDFNTTGGRKKKWTKGNRQ